MSNQQTENSENRLRVIPLKYPVLIGCVILPIILVALCLSPIVTNAINVMANQRKWDSARITNYSITIGLAGPGSQPAQDVIVKDGKFEQSTINFIGDGKTESRDGFSWLNLTVDDLFSQANGCFVYRLCSVEFDKDYGYPTYIGGGFVEFSWIYAKNLRPDKTEG